MDTVFAFNLSTGQTQPTASQLVSLNFSFLFCEMGFISLPMSLCPQHPAQSWHKVGPSTGGRDQEAYTVLPQRRKGMCLQVKVKQSSQEHTVRRLELRSTAWPPRLSEGSRSLRGLGSQCSLRRREQADVRWSMWRAPEEVCRKQTVSADGGVSPRLCTKWKRTGETDSLEQRRGASPSSVSAPAWEDRK